MKLTKFTIEKTYHVVGLGINWYEPGQEKRLTFIVGLLLISFYWV